MCEPVYAGTREELILVSAAPPKTTSSRNGAPSSRDGAPRRAELADFLRTKRAAIKPEEVGLPGGGRRRTPGLRREEVAQLSGVGTTWYTWLEQGRDVRASLSVLEALADALALTPAERSHLILLGRGEEAADGAPREEVPPTLVRLIENLGTSPAYISGRRWDYLAWNRALTVVFGDPAELPEGRRNMMWAVFNDPARRKLFGSDWGEGARNAVARFRADCASYIGDPHFEELIEALKESSPEFRRWWKRHEVIHSGMGRKVLRHPKAGKLVFEHAVFKLEETPEQRLILYTPLPMADTRAKVARLLR